MSLDRLFVTATIVTVAVVVVVAVTVLSISLMRLSAALQGLSTFSSKLLLLVLLLVLVGFSMEVGGMRLLGVFVDPICWMQLPSGLFADRGVRGIFDCERRLD